MGVSRREVMAGAAAGAALAPGAHAAVRRPHAWPKGFLWGVATAAHQIEGQNWNSDYWVAETVPSTGFSEPSGDACDSWDRWREDVALIKGLGLNTYRFSVEWARIEPEPGMFSLAALDHYRRICAACREAGITPMVTFHHFTSPRWIAGRGGWENPETADRFVRYCERTAKAIGDLLDWACTVNEPNGQVSSYVVGGRKPFAREAQIRAEAAKAVGSDRFCAYFQGNALKVRDVCIDGHRRGREAIKAANPNIKVGMTLALQELKPGPGGERLYREIFDEARTPFYEAANGDDFIGVQPYMRLVTTADGYAKSPPGPWANRTGADVPPDVLPAVVREVHAHCRAPIVITENGIDAVDDAQRMRHLRASVEGLHGAMAQGIPVGGYVHWSLIDNFEWSSGFKPRFGLYAVDRKTFARTPKPAAAAYRAMVAAARRA